MHLPSATLPDERTHLLLRRVVDLYQQNLARSPVPRQWLASRGLADCARFARFQIGSSDGRLPKLLPNGPDVRRELMELGLLDRQGREILKGCVIFPTFSVNGEVENLWGYPAS